jgi:pyruvate,orthophosphate dikinase
MFADEGSYRKGGLVLATGLAASPGAAVGQAVFSADDAEAWHARGEQVIGVYSYVVFERLAWV